jgi:hypothetical protein
VGGGGMAQQRPQDLGQLGGPELAGSARAVRESGQPNRRFVHLSRALSALLTIHTVMPR